MQQRMRAFEQERFRTIQIAAETARNALDAEVALEKRRGAARDVAVAGDEKNFHQGILTSCIASP
jgi:hypothetical protein